VCELCGYRSRENNTNYLHYHKYFKHQVPLPLGWTVYTCDICGKEFFTKFQLKVGTSLFFAGTLLLLLRFNLLMLQSAD
jgi:hypothetical protein